MMTPKMQTLDDLMGEAQAIREEDIARDEAYAASPAGQAARAARIADDIRRGIRDADGHFIIPDEVEVEEEEAEEEDPGA